VDARALSAAWADAVVLIHDPARGKADQFRLEKMAYRYQEEPRFPTIDVF